MTSQLLPRRTGRDIATGVLAALALLAALGGVPALLYLIAGAPVPHHLPSPGQLNHALTRRDDGTLFLSALDLIAWAAWAVFAASVVLETLAQTRGRLAPRIRGAAPIQHLAAVLVAAVATLLVTTPISRPSPISLLPTQAIAATTTVTPSPAASSATWPTISNNRPPGTAGAEETNTVTYSVARGDTLWSIAEQRLADPERWTEIASLNYGRPQPDGRALTNAHWIYPGWQLLLPADATGPFSPPPVPAQPMPSPLPATTPPANEPTPTPATGNNGQEPGAAAAPRPVVVRPVITLPDGGLVTAGFAAGVSVALATARLQRRRRRLPTDPLPGLRTGDPLLTSTVAQIVRAQVVEQPDDEQHQPAPPLASPPELAHPLQAVVAVDDAEQPHVVDLCAVPGLALTGPGAAGTMRALALAVRAANPTAVRMLLTETIAALLPGVANLRDITVARDPAELAERFHRDVLERARLLDTYGAESLQALLAEHPDETEPYLLAATEAPNNADTGVLAALVDQAGRLGIGVVLLGPWERGATVTVDDEGTVETGAGPTMPDKLEGSHAVTLGSDAATQTIALLAEAEGASLPDVSAEAATGTTPAPAPAPAVAPPIQLRLFGPLRIAAGGQEIERGLRSKARELLAYLALHPAGTSAERAIEDLWPDVDFDRARDQFRTAVGNLRGTLRAAAGRADAKIVEHPTDRYELDPALFDVDVWAFQRALGTAVRVPDADRVTPFTDAADTYTGDLLAGAPYIWVEPIREDLRRRATDTLSRLGEIAVEHGDLDQAVGWYERAIGVEPYEEELYRRLMRLHTKLGRPDATRRTYRQLQTRLDELQVDPDPATEHLLAELMQAESDRPSRPRRDAQPSAHPLDRPRLARPL